MTLEIRGFDRQRDGRPAGAAAITAALFCEHQGTSSADAHTTGLRGGEYAAGITITALRRIGALSGEIDVEAFELAIREIESQLHEGQARMDLSVRPGRIVDSPFDYPVALDIEPPSSD
ncbi:hypothetical protein KC878_03655 [Candidatus Saccharibacteria bacterium]|nr:hypothetical protein [Candidatus Saccharibacteria bacterium]MCB9820950.1 hypothetical protein [Candidatus Nomurabacteria bacterium]